MRELEIARGKAIDSLRVSKSNVAAARKVAYSFALISDGLLDSLYFILRILPLG